MRAGAFLLLFTLSAAAQTPRPAAPTFPISGAPGSTTPSAADAPPTEYTAVVRGRVVRADTGRPLRLARVTLSTPTSQTAVTDDEGRYELKGVPAGRYTLTAAKGGFVSVKYGQRSPNQPERPLDVRNGDLLEKLDFALPRGGVIAGVVLDDRGDPRAGVLVNVLRQRYENGVRRLAEMPTREMTDDLGRFRLFGLQAGTYYLSAAVTEDGEERSQAPRKSFGTVATLYPGTLSTAQAQPIEIAPGQEVSELMFALVPAKMATLRGVVAGSDGQPLRGVSLNLFLSEYGSIASTDTSIGPDGSFSIANLGPGEYIAAARDTERMAIARVVIDGADAVLPLTLSKGRVVRGRVTFEGGSAPLGVKPSTGFVRLESTLVPMARTARTGDDWAFEVAGLVGPHRFVIGGLPDGWTVSRIRHNGADVIDSGVDVKDTDIQGVQVVLTQRLTRVIGTVRDDRARTVDDATVVIFADDPSKWGPRTRFLKVARPDQDGRFEIRGLPPARYLAVALTDLEPGDETNPETLERISRTGARVMLAEGESSTLNLRLSTAP